MLRHCRFRSWCLARPKHVIVAELLVHQTMSQQPPSDRPEAASGLGHSGPLVQVATVAPTVNMVRPAVDQQLTSSSTGTIPVTDHPLAGPPPPPPLNTPTVSTDPMAFHPTAPQLDTPQPIQAKPSTALPENAAAVVSPSVPLSVTLDSLADQFLSGPSPRMDKGLAPLLGPSPIPEGCSELEKLRLLVNRRSWGDVVRMTERLLRGSNSHYASIYGSLLNNNNVISALDSQQHDLVWIMMVECQARLKLRRYEELGLEVDLWTFCHHHQQNDSTTAAPEWIPWKLHIQAASTLLYTTSSTEPVGSNSALDALWSIRRDIKQDDALSLLHVDHALSNAFIRLKEWRLAVSSQQRMLDELPGACQQQAAFLHGDAATGVEETASTLEKAYRCTILSHQARVLLQLGTIKEASLVFEAAGAAMKDMPESLSSSPVCREAAVQAASVQLLVNEGLLRFAYANYSEALEFFHKAVQKIRQIGSSSYSAEGEKYTSLLPSTMDCSPLDTLYSEATNNIAICAMYTCRLREALHSLESLVREDPSRYLTERVALNLSTLYELSNESTVSARKKRVLQLIAKRFCLHDIAQTSFRL